MPCRTSPEGYSQRRTTTLGSDHRFRTTEPGRTLVAWTASTPSGHAPPRRADEHRTSATAPRCTTSTSRSTGGGGGSTTPPPRRPPPPPPPLHTTHPPPPPRAPA